MIRIGLLASSPGALSDRYVESSFQELADWLTNTSDLEVIRSRNAIHTVQMEKQKNYFAKALTVYCFSFPSGPFQI